MDTRGESFGFGAVGAYGPLPAPPSRLLRRGVTFSGGGTLASAAVAWAEGSSCLLLW